MCFGGGGGGGTQYPATPPPSEAQKAEDARRQRARINQQSMYDPTSPLAINAGDSGTDTLGKTKVAT